MAETDHLANARTYLAIAESEDSKREAYTKAADEIIAWLAEDPRRSMREVDRRLGKGASWTGKLVAWRTSDDHHRALPFGGERQRAAVDRYQARRVLADPDALREAMADQRVRQAVHRAYADTEPPVLRPPAPAMDAGEAWRLAMRRISNAVVDIRMAGELVTDWGREWEAGAVAPERREALASFAIHLADAAQALSEAVNTPTDEQFAAFLASLPATDSED